MKRLNDEDIQKFLEQGLGNEQPDLDDKSKTDLDTYQLLFEVLKKEPEQGPSHSFSNKLRSVLKAEYRRKNARRFYLSLVLIFFAMGAIMLFIFAYLDNTYKTAFLYHLASGKWVCLLGFGLLFIIQYADQKLLKAKFEHQQI